MQKSSALLALVGILVLSYYANYCNDSNQDGVQRGMQSNKKVHNTQPCLGSIAAHDGVTLAYACYIPEHPHSALVFYHGSGAHSLAGYTYMAEQLAQQYSIATFLFDIRGHGRSGGPRGDAPSIDTMWHDVRIALTFVQEQYNVPVFLGGHSGGAGMLVNYASWSAAKQPVGYILVAPMLGRHAHVVRAHQTKSKKPFAQVNYIALAINEMTQGLLAGRWHAVSFNYPQQLVDEKGFVKDYTVNMVQTMHPSDPAGSLVGIKVPVLVCIADHDELFDATKMDRFFQPIVLANQRIKVKHIDAHHLTVLGTVHDAIGEFVVH